MVISKACFSRIEYKEVFELLTTTDMDVIQIAEKQQNNSFLLCLIYEANFASPYFELTNAPFFMLLEMHVKESCKAVLSQYPPDHLLEQTFMLINTSEDVFEMMDTLVSFLQHYQHPAALAIEDISLTLDEKARRISANNRSLRLIGQAAEILKLKNPESKIETLMQPLIDLC
jgi:hypothetical protein